MAKHFKQPDNARLKGGRTRETGRHASGQAAQPQPIQPRQQQYRQSQVMPYEERMPYGLPASYRGVYEEPVSVGRDIYWDDVPERGGIFSFLRGLLLLLAWIFRLAALAMVVLVILNGLSLPVFRSTLATVTDVITSYLPWRNVGLLAVDTPFGGVLRGDLSLIALFLFVMDWLLCRSRRALR